MAKNKETKLLEETTKEVLSLVGLKSSFKIEVEDESFVVNIDPGEEAGLLIGHHGETLNSLQTILGLIFRQKTGEWKRIVVNVGDWRQKQEERLSGLAKQVADRAIETGEAQPIYNLTPAQRRVVHMSLSENQEVETESQGEGNERYLIVRPKKSQK